MSPRRSLLVACIVAALTAGLVADESYVPVRVFRASAGQVTDFESMLADIAGADVVFVGEEHDDANTHRLELMVLQGLALRRGDITLSLEMFERDVQEPLGHFLMGHTSEDEFLKNARPWPDYARDYQPLVDFAASKTWPIVAANVPRTIAAAVAASGLTALASRPEAERAWFAKDVQCPTNDQYFRHFVDAMGGHAGTTPGGSTATDRETLDRFYDAQCLKDETMAESIAQADFAGSIGGVKALVVHVNGAFHSDYGDGTVARTRRRLPGKRVVVLTILPVTDLDRLAPDGDTRKRADYLVYTKARSK